MVWKKALKVILGIIAFWFAAGLLLSLVGCAGGDETPAPTPSVPNPDQTLPDISVGKPDVERGKAVYLENCAACHGETGRGNGPAAATLDPKPRNFTKKAEWKTYGNDSATLKVISDGGLAGLGRPSAMPAWKGMISQQDMINVLAYEKSLAK